MTIVGHHNEVQPFLLQAHDCISFRSAFLIGSKDLISVDPKYCNILSMEKGQCYNMTPSLKQKHDTFDLIYE